MARVGTTTSSHGGNLADLALQDGGSQSFLWKNGLGCPDSVIILGGDSSFLLASSGFLVTLGCVWLFPFPFGNDGILLEPASATLEFGVSTAFLVLGTGRGFLVGSPVRGVTATSRSRRTSRARLLHTLKKIDRMEGVRKV
jgi:hypothetical protein